MKDMQGSLENFGQSISSQMGLADEKTPIMEAIALMQDEVVQTNNQNETNDQQQQQTNNLVDQ